MSGQIALLEIVTIVTKMTEIKTTQGANIPLFGCSSGYLFFSRKDS